MMRLFLSALMVVITFASVVLLVSRLYPQGAGWAGVCVAITCLYASVFAVWVLFGAKTDKQPRSVDSESTQRHRLRDNLLYFAVAIAVLTVVVAMTIHDTERGIHRSLKNDWFVAFGSTCIAMGYAAKSFWTFRRNWRLWAIIAVLFLLFTAVTLPMFTHMEKVPLILMGPLANIELLVAILVLDRLVKKSHSGYGRARAW